MIYSIEDLKNSNEKKRASRMLCKNRIVKGGVYFLLIIISPPYNVGIKYNSNDDVLGSYEDY
jgi:hypothetical protein